MEIRVREGGCDTRLRIPVKPMADMFRSMEPSLRDSASFSLLNGARKDVIYASEGYEEAITIMGDYLLGKTDILPDSLIGRSYRAAYFSGGDTAYVSIRLFRSPYRKGSLMEVRGNGTTLFIPMFIVSPMLSLAKEDLKEYFGDPDRVLDFLMKGFEVVSACAGDTGVVSVR